MHTEKLQSEQMAVHWAADLDPGHSLSVQDRLQDLDLSDAQAAAVERIIESQIETQGMHYAAGVLRRIFLFMAGRNTTCAALAHGLGLHDEATLSQLAENLGCQKQAAQNLQRVLLPLLPFAPTATHRIGRREVVRPAAPGEWLSIIEVKRLCKQSRDKITAAAAAGEVVREFVGTQAFYREDSVLAWSERIEQSAAEARLLTARSKVCPHSQADPTSPPPSSRDLLGAVT